MNYSKLNKFLMRNFIWSHLQKSFIVRYWSELVRLPDGFTGLELGCGGGSATKEVVEQFKPGHLDVFDVDESLLSWAKDYLDESQAKAVDFKVGDILSIESPDGAYDAVFDFFSIADVQDWEAYVAKISELLKPGGYFIFAEIYETDLRKYIEHHILKKGTMTVLDRPSFVRELGSNRLRLFEKNRTVWGYGIVGVAQKV
jgi:ubiquinone/menaquinone biosynthesis C-methylase UbiE